MIRVVHPRIRIMTLYPSRIPDLGVQNAPDPGSGSATLGATCWLLPRRAFIDVHNLHSLPGCRSRRLVAQLAGCSLGFSLIMCSSPLLT
jgi:hypothetical protein